MNTDPHNGKSAWEIATDANEANATEVLMPVDQRRLVRPLWMTGSEVNDWPEDSTHENGNYFNKCVTCDTDFIGHKRRWVCKKCRTEDDARWEALSDAEKKAEMDKMSADFEAWLHSGTNACQHPTAEAP